MVSNSYHGFQFLLLHKTKILFYGLRSSIKTAFILKSLLRLKSVKLLSNDFVKCEKQMKMGTEIIQNSKHLIETLLSKQIAYTS